MDIFMQTMFVIGGAWGCLVAFLVMGVYTEAKFGVKAIPKPVAWPYIPDMKVQAGAKID